MPIRIMVLAVACLAFAPGARAETAWVGAQLHFPVPAADIGDTQLGVGAGVTFTRMLNAHVGVGVDLIQHYWPASSGYEAAFDRYLRTERMEALEGSDWALSAFQVTGHLKLVAPIGERVAPWMQVGAGSYRLNLNLDERRPPGTYAWVFGPAVSNNRVVAGEYGAIGLDIRTSRHVVLGVDAAIHHVELHKKREWGWGGVNDLKDFSAVTAGVHAMFGW